jgi:hypothetical protein
MPHTLAHHHQHIPLCHIPLLLVTIHSLPVAYLLRLDLCESERVILKDPHAW